MPEKGPQTTPKTVLEEPRPWPFSRAELTAGLRRHTGDPSLQTLQIDSYDIPMKRPSIGIIRGLQVTCQGRSGERNFILALKEPLGSTRTGTAGVGLREVSVYQILVEQLPVQIPELMAAHPLGDWLVLNLLPSGRDPESWTADDYLRAIDQLITLHDRFWGLGDDLTIYTWLARPLDSDFEIYVKAAAKGVSRLVGSPGSALLHRDPGLAQLLGHLVLHADQVAAFLQHPPATLIHGDYWPGNIHMAVKGPPIVYDWQQAGIGPGVLDLVAFVQASLWWFDPIPISPDRLVTHYREGMAEATGLTWEEADWEALWDSALLWTFLAHWIDLMAAIPESLVETRYEQFEAVWLAPLRSAAARHLQED